VGTRTTAGAARGAVGRHLACAQGHQGSGVDTMGRSEGTTRRTSRVGAAVGVLSHRSGKVQGGEAETGRGVNGGHAERFCVGVLEIVEAGERVVGEARGSSVDEVGALGVLKNLLEGTFHCRCGDWIEGKVVVKMSTNK
jgi:hypothetical protein